MTNYEYAPVLIPTLCRYKHFKQCLESLEQCTGSDKTKVFIALDYPLSPKHEEGYNQIVGYLSAKEKDHHFMNLYTIRRERNFGIGVCGNFASAQMELFKEYDRLILSEDDNIFSPNFLEYINKGLELYKNNKSILAINGYCHPYQFKFSTNNHFLHNTDFSAWGYGIWRDKVEAYKLFIYNNGFQKSLSLKSLQRTKKSGLNRLLDYLRLCFKKLNKDTWITDAILSNFMEINDMFVIMPRISKVRNIGWDNTGNSSKNGILPKRQKIANRHNSQSIDTNYRFEYEGSPKEYYKENNQIAVQESDGKISLIYFLKQISIFILKYIYKKYQQ